MASLKDRISRVPDRSPILQYARAGSSIDDIPGAKRIQLARPAAWPKLVANSFALPIVILGTLILMMFGGWVIFASRGIIEATSGVLILLIALLPAATGYQLILEMLSLRRAGNRPIIFALGDGAILIDDAAQRTIGLIEVRREHVTSLGLLPAPTIRLRQKIWTLRIVGFPTKLEIEFFEEDNARAEAVLDQIRSCLKPPLPLREGEA
jgi:hypothetical protein